MDPEQTKKNHHQLLLNISERIRKSKIGFVVICFALLYFVFHIIAIHIVFFPPGASTDFDDPLIPPFNAGKPSTYIYMSIFYVHIFTGTIALILGSFQFLTRLWVNYKVLHRWLGRIYLGVGVLVGGVTGLYLSFYAATGAVASIGFAIASLLWLYTGLQAYLTIRARNIVAHSRWMIRNFALTLAAFTLRIYALPLVYLAGISFEIAYPISVWLSWLGNLIVAELLFNRANKPSLQQKAYSAS